MRLVALNELGRRIGEHHPHARLTNAQIDEVLTLHEEQGLAYSALAERFGVSKSCIAGICQYRRRGQWVAAWRKVKE